MKKIPTPLLIILILGLGIRFILFFVFLDKYPVFFFDDDSYTYLALAENVEAGRGFSVEFSPPFKPNAFRTPGYLIFLLGHKFLFGSFIPAIVSQIFLAGVIAVLIFLLARHAGYSRLGYFSAGLFLFMPFSLMVSLQYLTQIIFASALLTAVWQWTLFLQKKKWKNFWISAILLPLTVLIRPIALWLYVPFAISLIIAEYWSESFDKKKLFKNITYLIALFFLIISPWMIRNYRTFGQFSFSSITYWQMYFYDLPSIYATANRITYDEAKEFLNREIEDFASRASLGDIYWSGDFTNTPLLKERFWHYAWMYPGAVVETRLILFFKFFIRDGIRHWFDYFGHSRLGWAVFFERSVLFSLFGGMMVMLWHSWRSRNIIILFWILIILYFASLTGIMASAGLRFPVEPLFILVGVLGLSRLKNLIIQLYHNV